MMIREWIWKESDIGRNDSLRQQIAQLDMSPLAANWEKRMSTCLEAVASISFSSSSVMPSLVSAESSPEAILTIYINILSDFGKAGLPSYI